MANTYFKLMLAFANSMIYLLCTNNLLSNKNYMPKYIEQPKFSGYLFQNTKFLIIYCHGGGYVMGHALQSKRFFYKMLQKDPQFSIFSLQYTLNDSNKAYQELCDCIDYFQQQNYHIQLFGTSAGGHMCLKYCYKHNSKNIDKLILCSPWINPQEKIIHHSDYVPPKILNQISDMINEENMNKKLSLPPTFIIYGDRECFVSQIESFLEKNPKIKTFVGVNREHAFLVLPFINRNIKDTVLLELMKFIEYVKK